MSDSLKIAESRIILDAIRRLVEALRISSRESERRLGISGAQLFVLQKLALEKGLSMNQLADRTFTHQSSVSTVVSRLEEKGLVVRERSSEDARKTVVRITPVGKRLLARAPDPTQNRIFDAIAELGAKDRTSLARNLRILTDNAGLGGKPVPLFFEGKNS